MSPWAPVLAWALMLSLIVYALTGGADFGGGVWDLLAGGSRARAQRAVIAKAIAPIWEANHVWMIAAVVLLFTCFPAVFAEMTTYLHVPLALVLLGIVMRGSAFMFREQAGPDSRWRLVFSVSSLLTPFFLGMVVGCLAGGRLPLDGAGQGFAALFLKPWLAPFPAVMGALTVCLFAFLAAVYLTLETSDADLQEDFRRRALASGAAVGLCAGAALLLARAGAPALHARLLLRSWSMGFQALTGLVSVCALAALWRRRFKAARALAVAQVALVLSGWGLAQSPYLIYPRFTYYSAAAPDVVLRISAGLLVVGAALVLPSFVWLFRVFKRLP